MGSLTKWAFTSSRGPSRESSPPQEEDPGQHAQAAADNLAEKADAKIGQTYTNDTTASCGHAFTAGC